MQNVVLYGHPDSGHACKVALALSLAAVQFEPIWIDIWAEPSRRPPSFLSISPFAEVPLLSIDGEPFTQSGAILLTIAARFGGERFGDAASLKRGRALLMWEANRIGMCLPQLKEAYREGSGGLDPAVLIWLHARDDVDRVNFDILLDGKPFFHGNAPGIGDCAIWGYTQWLDAARVEPTQQMQQWIDRMRALPEMKTPAEFFPRPAV